MPKKYLTLLLAFLLLSQGCATKTPQTAQAYYYPDCRQPIMEVENLGFSGSGMVRGGVGGAFVGGASGFLLGLLFGGNAARAGVGAAVGASGGAITGGLSGGMGGQSGENRLLAKYYQQIEGDIANLDVYQAAGTVAMECYQKRLKQLPELEEEGRVDREAAQKRRAEIEAGMARARELIDRRK